jgi:hypothetical protein
MSITPDSQTPSLAALNEAINSLLCTEKVPEPGFCIDQLVVPLSTVVPLENVKFSTQKSLAVALLAAALTEVLLVQPFEGLVTVKV